jgi:hypothetical protein
MAIPFHDRRTGQVLYHGTTAELSPGDVIKPAVEVGTHNWKKDDKVSYATNDLGAATFFANEAANNASEAAQKFIPKKIYKVSPVSDKDLATRPMRDMKAYAVGEDTPLELSSPKGFHVISEVPEEQHPDLTELQFKNIQRRFSR